MQPNAKLSKEQALIKIQKYCAYQERSHKEVKDKLYSFGLWKEQVEDIILQLINDNFLNEERFAEAYARGKFKFKQWGKSKIKLKLKEKGVSDYCIKKGLAQIEEEDYLNTIAHLIEKKYVDYHPKNHGYKLKAKLINYLLQKGYEYEVVKQKVEEKF